MGQAKRETPRWRRKPAPSGPAVVLKGRHLKAYLAQQAAVQAAAAATPAAKTPVASVLARTGAYRFRRHLTPCWLLAGIAALGLGAHAFHSIRATAIGVVLGVLSAAGLWLLTRHLKTFSRRAGAAMAALTVVWVPVLTLAGTAVPWPALLFASWLPLMWVWAKHYRWRPDEKRDEPDPDDVALWATTLGAKGRLAGSALCLPSAIPSGTSYTLRLKRGDQDSSDVFGMSKKIASLYGKPVTEVYPERFPDGREHEVTLTLLRKNTLSRVRMDDGSGIDPATGLAVIGDFPDGTAAHFRFWSPRNGTEQSVVVGVKGSGKSYLLHLLLVKAVRSTVPVVPIVLDPQQGQSLPDWRGKVTYARGVPQCMLYLRAFEAGMKARSDYLADLAWTDEDGYERPGMDFFDPLLCGLPPVFMVFDEAHLVLGDPKYGPEAIRIVGNLAKLDRKAGGHLMLVSHSLLLSQLGDMTLRAMVVGGNAVALRTGENLSGGIIGLEADPKLLPRIFPDGSETHGLGYIAGPDNRPDSPMRVRLVRNPRKVAVESQIAEMDDVFGNAFRAVLDAAGRAGPAVRPAAVSTTLAAVPPPEDDKPGRTAADAILAVLDREMTRGEIIVACGLVTKEWGRKPFSTKALSDALSKLASADQIDKPGHGTYAPRKPSLHSVGGSATVRNGVNA